MRYEFATATRIVAGPGVSEELGKLAGEIGKRALVVQRASVPGKGGAAGVLVQSLVERGLACATYSVDGEPTVATVEEAARLALENRCDMTIGIGGGSVMDTAKAAAALSTNPGGALEYMEVVGKGKALSAPPLPIITVPTTAGTGSEVTRNAVVAALHVPVKASIRSAMMLPRLALIDSALTHDLPPAITASTGMDALTQLLEAYVSRRAEPITDGFCTEGLARAAWALPCAYHNPTFANAREAMSTAALLSGLALANAGLGADHGIAAPLCGAYPVPHGAATAALLAPVCRVNIQALLKRAPDNPALGRYKRAAEILLGRPATPDELVKWLADLAAELGIPRLGTYGLTADKVHDLAVEASRASSTKGNPIDLEVAELEEAISKAL